MMDKYSLIRSFIVYILFHLPSVIPLVRPFEHSRSRTDTRTQRWADAAFEFVSGLNCQNVFLTSHRECRKLITIPKSAMNIYLAPVSPLQYGITLPDEDLSDDGLHDAVLVIDPYPNANFGHLVIVFYVDTNMDRIACHYKDGIYVGDSTCMTLAKKDRCRNALQRRSRRRKFARRCEINFLPFVSQIGMDEGRPYWGKYRKNYLSCVDGVRGFARCPQLRPLNETTDIICNHLRQNTRRCSTTQGMIHTSCRMFETCDQAVVISGGWNQLSSGIRYERNIQDVYGMLRTYGFKKRNIQIFFANGMPSIHVPGETGHKVHPTALKLAMRYHIRSLCHMSHCADSLVIYMNSPADNDGSAFLWDVNYDGLAEKSERYSVKEFKRDLASCRAKEVHVIVDQSFSGEVADAFRNSHNHQNVIVYASSKGNEYSANDEYTRHWTNSNHTHSCSFDIHEKSKNSVSYSTPTIGEGRTGKVQKTIFGAPCDVTPPFTKSELRRDYLGCQNMPTAMWVMRFFRNRSPIIELNSDRNRS